MNYWNLDLTKYVQDLYAEKIEKVDKRNQRRPE